MRVLILWSDINGDRSGAADALSEQFAKLNIECETAELLSFFTGKEMLAKLSAKYARACRSESERSVRALFDLCERGTSALQTKWQAEGFDTVVSTHALAAILASCTKEKYSSSVATYFVSTDYTRVPGLGELQADGYFVPHGMLYGDFIRSVIPADRLLASGIPLPSAFYAPCNREAAREALGLPLDGRLVLVNCTGLVHRRAFRNLLKLTARLPQEVNVAVLCGKNEKLFKQLQRHPSARRILVRETDHMTEYLSAAEVYITPPVGILVAEAMAKRVPTLLKGSLPGYESRNAAFLADRGVTALTRSPEQAADAVLTLLKHPEQAEPQLVEMEHIMPPIAAEQICRYIIKHEI